MEVKTGSYYKHFKGHIYKVLMIAKHSETLEDMVIYENVETKEVWARPKASFMSKVDEKKYPDINFEYRFEEVNYVS